LSTEASKRYETLKSKMSIALNKIKEMGISIGTKLMPALDKTIGTIGKWVDKFDELDDKQVETIVQIGLLIAAAYPLISFTGKVTSAIGGVMTAIGMFNSALKVSRGEISSTNSTVNALATVISGVTSPVGIACTLIGTAFMGIKIAADQASKGVDEKFTVMANAATDFYSGIQNAESHLKEFNITLFSSTEEQQKLKQNMSEIQEGITKIARTASDERREYTQQEIQKLDEYFEQLRTLKERELEIQKSLAGAITQQAQTAFETFDGSFEKYKEVSQEWIKTAQEQKDAQIQIIEQQTTEEIALLNIRYGEKATLENEEYKREYTAIIENQKQAIDFPK